MQSNDIMTADSLDGVSMMDADALEPDVLSGDGKTARFASGFVK